MSKDIMRVTKKYMHHPVEISVAAVNKGAENVTHLYYMVQARDRYEVLKRIADINPDIYGIVFCRTRRETKDVANKLMQDGYNADVLNGDLSQAQRDDVMNKFRKQKLQILVATDVAARGLDVNNLTHVINYNLPDDSEVYTHRSGRTGRAGKSGVSIAIIHTRETRKIKDIEKKSGIRFTKELVPRGEDICKKQLYKLIDKIQDVKVDENQIEPFLPTIYEKLQSLNREELIKHFVSAEFNRFLDYYKNARDINVSEGQRNRNDDKRGGRDRKRGSNNGSFTTIYVNIGGKNHINPSRLIGLINETLNSKNAKIGRIEISKNFSLFEIEEKMKTEVIQSLTGKNFGSVSIFAKVSQEKHGDSSFSKRKSSRRKDFKNRKNDGRKKYKKW